MHKQSPGATSRGQNEPIAVVGMSCIFPGAADLDEFWKNIVSGRDSIREADEREWGHRSYKNGRDSKSFGRIYCTKGGFITEFAQFDPLEFGIMPSSIRGGDPDQYLALRAAAEALRDAGYYHKTFEAERADVIIGRTMAPGAGSLNLIQHGQTVDQVLDVLSTICPDLDSEQLVSIESKLKNSLQPCSAETIPAVMPNVLAGRIAAKLGFRGRSLVLDAACASSLIAVETAMQGLRACTTDIAIAGGVHINSHPYFYQMFSELGALSHQGVIRPFDDAADGTILGEGVGMIVLKRLSDAQRDNNRVYAVIKGIGSSSDGRGGGSLAPNVSGESAAVRRALEDAAVSPQSIELLEAHGTGTRVGDLVEMNAVGEVYGANARGKKQWCALGSIKSMIGHTQAASGIAGMIKSALALYHRTLPPTLNLQKPNAQVNWADSPCYINTSAKPWGEENSIREEPRRAGVSAFGFGGVNAHVVLEEAHHPDSCPTLPDVPEISSGSIEISLAYPEIKAGTLKNSMTFSSHAETNHPTRHETRVPVGTALYSAGSSPSADFAASASGIANYRASESASTALEDKDAVLQSFMNTMGSFQRDLLQAQESVMLSYLVSPEESEFEVSRETD